MYLQITTKCNMTCDHCYCSCTMRGKHADKQTWEQMIYFASQQDSGSITIGGGEPTLHPDFFPILKECLDEFDYVWMATNGSITKSMYRLASIIDNCDYENVECTCSEDDKDSGNCNCQDSPDIIWNDEKKLTVALSQDYWHDPINERIVSLWENRARQHKHSGYELRDVSKSRDGASAEGRAKKTGAGGSDHCVCPDMIIKPDGKIKLCGCTHSPVIGNIWDGVSDKWQKVLYSDKFQDSNCYKSLKRK